MNQGDKPVVGEESSTYIVTHYIPHHAVEKDSLTTPIRIAFDKSCQKSSDLTIA